MTCDGPGWGPTIFLNIHQQHVEFLASISVMNVFEVTYESLQFQITHIQLESSHFDEYLFNC